MALYTALYMALYTGSLLRTLARTRCSAVFGEHYPFVHKPVHEHKKTRLLHQPLARLRLELDFLSVYQPLCAAYVC